MTTSSRRPGAFNKSPPARVKHPNLEERFYGPVSGFVHGAGVPVTDLRQSVGGERRAANGPAVTRRPETSRPVRRYPIVLAPSRDSRMMSA